MREIEFRAWLKDENKMIYVPIIDFRDKKIKTLYGQDCYEWNYSFDEIELMQYTGLKDKNNVEIFEGDIVKHDKGNRYEVTFNNGAFTLLRYNFYEGKPVAYYDFQTFVELKRMGELEIIGNIYENKELLEEKNA